MHRWLPFILFWLVAGCARYEPKPLAPAQTASKLEARTLADLGLRTFVEANTPESAKEWPRRSWDLAGLTLVAFFYHPSLAVARAQWGIATAAIKTAAGRPNPTASVTPGYNFNAASGISPWFPGFAFGVPIETAGKRGKRTSRAEYLAESARQNVSTVAWRVRSNVRTALIDLTMAKRRRNLLREQLEVQQRIAELLEQWYRAGAASAVEVSAARVALMKLQANEADVQRQMAEARNRLAEALGLPVAALVGARFRLLLESVSNLAALPDKAKARRLALQQRSDIRAALANYEASQSALQIEVAKQYPDLHLGSGYVWDQGDNKWDLAINLELPILNRNEGPIAEAEAKREETAAQLLALQAKVIAEIDRAAAALSTTTEQLKKLHQVHQASKDHLRLVQARLAVGAVDQIAFQNAKLEVGVSALAALDAEAKASLATGQLEEALQIPFKALSVAEQHGDAQGKRD
ncbi:MAG: TolC family protein [Gammaproteobacteria bacterium]